MRVESMPRTPCQNTHMCIQQILAATLQLPHFVLYFNPYYWKAVPGSSIKMPQGPTDEAPREPVRPPRRPAARPTGHKWAWLVPRAAASQAKNYGHDPYCDCRIWRRLQRKEQEKAQKEKEG